MTIETSIKGLDTLNTESDRIDPAAAETPPAPRTKNELPPPAIASITDSGRVRFGAGFRLKPRG
jgi:hypothetical protein